MKQVRIVHLYGREMNIYGDNGNLETVEWRLRRSGYRCKLSQVSVGDKLPNDTDIIIAGGGQDSGQLAIVGDLKTRASELRSLAEDGVVMLAVCGSYQLFGHYFVTSDQTTLAGVGIFNCYTIAKPRRIIGNIVLSSPYGCLVGFENHSGQTFLEDDQLPLGKVVKGIGNNEADDKEGAVYKNVFGTYMHGPVLPKNPKFADELIRRALKRRYGKADLEHFDDSLALKAAEIAAKRPR